MGSRVEEVKVNRTKAGLRSDAAERKIVTTRLFVPCSGSNPPHKACPFSMTQSAGGACSGTEDKPCMHMAFTLWFV